MPDSYLHLKRKSFRNTLKAQWRDARVLYQESRMSIVLFLLIILGGTLCFHFIYVYPETGLHPNFSEALYATFALVFFDTVLPYPGEWYLQILFFLIPILGLAVVADGLLRFGTALTNKQARGQKWQVAMASIYRDHIIVCGLGKVGYRVMLELLKYGRDVVAIETNEIGRFIEKAKALGIPVILGDARRSDFIRQAGVEYADAIIPATDDELGNLEIALDAREINPDIKVVMRMFNSDLARRVEKGFGIHTAFSSSALTAPIFAAAAMRVNVKHSFYVGDDLLNLSEIVIQPKSELIGWNLEKLEQEFELSVVYYQSEEVRDLHPDPERCLKAEDTILVLASIETLQQINKVNK
jgi:Trk K+ transport system NAD-binding subunit